MLGPLCAVTLSFKRKTHLFQEQKLCTQKRTRWEPWFLNGAEIEPTAQRFIQRSVFHLWLVTLQLNVTLSRRIPMSHRFVGLNLQRYPALFLGYAIDVHSILYHSIRTPNTETGQVRSPTRSVVLRCVQLRNTCNLLQQWKWFPKQLKRPKKERAYCSLRTGWSMTSLVAEAWWRTACCALSLSRPRTVAFNIGNYIITWSDDSQTAILILPIRFNAERFIHFISSAWDVQRAKKLGIYLHLTQTVIFLKKKMIFGRIIVCWQSMQVVQLYSTDHGIVRLQWLELLSNYTTSLSNLWRMQMPRTISMKSTWGLDLKTHCPPGHHDIWGIDRVCVCQALSSLDITDISYSISLPWGSKMTRIHTFWNVLNRGCLIMFSNVMFVLTLFTVLLFSSFGPSWHCFGPKCP